MDSNGFNYEVRPTRELELFQWKSQRVGQRISWRILSNRWGSLKNSIVCDSHIFEARDAWSWRFYREFFFLCISYRHSGKSMCSADAFYVVFASVFWIFVSKKEAEKKCNERFLIRGFAFATKKKSTESVRHWTSSLSRYGGSFQLTWLVARIVWPSSVYFTKAKA